MQNRWFLVYRQDLPPLHHTNHQILFYKSSVRLVLSCSPYQSLNRYEYIHNSSRHQSQTIKLRIFSSLANKGTGSSHPSDQERWNDFICQAFTDKSENIQGILERWLIEEEKWHYEIASDLTIEFESGISLLEYYKENYNGR